MERLVEQIKVTYTSFLQPFKLILQLFHGFPVDALLDIFDLYLTIARPHT